MKLAIKEAKSALKRGDLPFGAVIVCNSKVVSIGQSRENTYGSVTAHAETDAVSKACKQRGLDLSDCVLYASGEPCNMCASAIFQAKIPKVIIGVSRKNLPHIFRQRRIGINDLAKDSGYRIKIIRGVMEKEATALFNNLKLR